MAKDSYLEISSYFGIYPLKQSIALRGDKFLKKYSSSDNYTVSQKKLWSRTLAITLSNLNRFQKFLHSCKEKEISNKPCVIIPTTP